MNRRVRLGLVGAIVGPAVLGAFLLGRTAPDLLSRGARQVGAQPVTSVQVDPHGLAEAFAAVAEATIPAVVNISAERRTVAGPRQQAEDPLEELFREFFGDGQPFPGERQRSSLGSGVVISPDGYVVTNNHVVAGFDDIAVRMSDGTEYKGKQVEVVGYDPKTDLAVLRIRDAGSLPSIRFGDADRIRVGSWAIAIGNPFGLQSTVTVGVVSAKGRSGIPLPEGPSYQDFIQTDASINPGNSGGALVDVRGELIGVNTAIRSPVGASVGIGFAVPVDMVKSVTSQLIQRGRVVRGFLGIRPQPLTDAIRRAVGLQTEGGVLVSEVLQGMPAAGAGLKAGDVILQIGGVTVENLDQFRRIVADFPPGKEVEVVVFRKGRRLTRQVTLIEFPDDERSSTPTPPESDRWLGLDIGPADDGKGVAVLRVVPATPAAEAGIRVGDVILEVDGEQVRDAAGFDRLVEPGFDSGRPLLLRLRRGDASLFVAIDPGE